MTTVQATSTVERALRLVRLGIPVFRVRVAADGTKTPMHENGHLDATLDPGLVHDWFSDTPNAQIGAHVGPANIVVADIDVKNGKDGWDSLDKSWLEVPETWGYDTPTGGRHLIYAAPEGLNLAPSTNYRGMVGVDTRAGSSWVLWNGDVPDSRDAFAPAPEWLLDERTVKSADEFKGDVKTWFDSLEPGDPNIIVRRAIDRIKPDMGHADMVAATYEAIRLGAEGNPGVPTLLSTLEDSWLSRDPGNHTTPEDRWEYKFQEALSSGIQKYGAAISLRANLPEYDLKNVPGSVPSSLVAGSAGDKGVFRDLLAALIASTDDDMLVTSILWNSPRTRDLSREWGLEFVHKRVLDAREVPEPKRENPTLPTPEPVTEIEPAHDVTETEPRPTGKVFLTAREQEIVARQYTFIDFYLEASASKGFSNRAYDVPAAWTALSMAFGRRAFIRLGKPIGVNLWFIELGESSTGKSSADGGLRSILNLIADPAEARYSLGAKSSPAALSEALLQRDNLASIVHHDEAADFFRGIKETDWMADLPDLQAKWYEGWVDPENKVRLPKELKGKTARTSFNIHMMGTPARVLKYLSADQFDSGYLARVNWSWNLSAGDPEAKYEIGVQAGNAEEEIPSAFVDVAVDLLAARSEYETATSVAFSDSAQARLRKAFRDFDKASQKHPRYSNFSPAVTRLGSETIWKCAALLSLHRGAKEVSIEDALVAIHYATDWLNTLHLIANQVAESAYSRDLEELEGFIRDQGGSVTQELLLHTFRGKIVRSRRELDDRIAFLLESGRINRVSTDNVVKYELNGG